MLLAQAIVEAIDERVELLVLRHGEGQVVQGLLRRGKARDVVGRGVQLHIEVVHGVQRRDAFVAGERRAHHRIVRAGPGAARVVDGEALRAVGGVQKFGEVALPHRQRRHGAVQLSVRGFGLRLPDAVPGERPEHLVPAVVDLGDPNGSGGHQAIVIGTAGGLLLLVRFERTGAGAGIEALALKMAGGVPALLPVLVEERAVQLVGAAARTDVDRRAGGEALRSVEVRRLHFEFRNGIGGRHVAHAAAGAGDRHAVNGVFVLPDAAHRIE